jgi:hypothetical protein
MGYRFGLVLARVQTSANAKNILEIGNLGNEESADWRRFREGGSRF